MEQIDPMAGYLQRLKDRRDGLELMWLIYQDMPQPTWGDDIIVAQKMWDLEAAVNRAHEIVMVEVRILRGKIVKRIEQGGQHGEDTQTQEKDTQARPAV